MHHFNLKSLAFYGVAIGSVLILFKAVTAYGETRLKAPQKISDRYLLTFKEQLPNCQTPNSLSLQIQQSGIYVNASLLPANTNAEIARAAEKKPKLTGLIDAKQITLSGTVPTATICSNSNQKITNIQSVNLKMHSQTPKNLLGEITINSMTKSLQFNATPQKTRESTEKFHQ